MPARWIAVVALATICSGCQPDGAVWLARINAPETARVGGVWQFRMSAEGGTAPVTGSLALLVNREEHPTLWNPSPPTLTGTYTIAMARLDLPTESAPFEATGSASKDSVELVLNPDRSGSEVWLTGVWQSDSITGRWMTRGRSGPTRSGSFVMRRP